MSRRFFAAIALMTTGFCVAGTAARVEDLAWLSGCWAPDGAEAGTSEHWMPPAGGSMIGMSRFVMNGDTRAWEYLRIVETGDSSLTLFASPSGQEPAEFQLAGIEENEVVFENPEHDFPQRIIYRLLGSNRLLGRIEGETEEGPMQVEFPMTRVNCDAS